MFLKVPQCRGKPYNTHNSVCVVRFLTAETLKPRGVDDGEHGCCGMSTGALRTAPGHPYIHTYNASPLGGGLLSLGGLSAFGGGRPQLPVSSQHNRVFNEINRHAAGKSSQTQARCRDGHTRHVLFSPREFFHGTYCT